jgi:hypothetical protein
MSVADADFPDPLNDPRTTQADPATLGQGADRTADDQAADGTGTTGGQTLADDAGGGDVTGGDVTGGEGSEAPPLPA